MVDLTVKVQQKLRSQMKNKDDVTKRFIVEEDVSQIYTDKLRQLFPSSEWQEDDIERIQKSFLKVLSILILAGWPDVCEGHMTCFRTSFFNHPSRTDQNLPFNENDDLEFLGHTTLGFYDWQHAFCPVAIKEYEYSDDHIQTVDSKKRRLPLIEKDNCNLGEGSSGRVDLVIIPRFCHHKYSASNACYVTHQDIYVARKIFHAESNSQTSMKQCRRELENLGLIKNALGEQKRIVKHMASLIYGDDVMILLPFADLYDLEAFFGEGYKAVEYTRPTKEIYVFDSKFPGLTYDKLQKGIKEEAFGLAEALRWLHTQLRLPRKLQHYLAHMDIKPENILIFSHSASPIGRFKLSDFGVSWFKEAVEEIKGKVHSDGSQDTQTLRYHGAGGTYQPPEINEGELHPSTTDGRKCDVWSFGCLLTDLLAFAIGRKHELQRLQRLRSERSNGLSHDYFYDIPNKMESPNDTSINPTFEVKSCIREWLASQKRSYRRPWVLAYVELVETILKPDPSDRPTMDVISDRLHDLAVLETSNNSLPPNDIISETAILTIDEDSSTESHATRSETGHTTSSNGAHSLAAHSEIDDITSSNGANSLAAHSEIDRATSSDGANSLTTHSEIDHITSSNGANSLAAHSEIDHATRSDGAHSLPTSLTLSKTSDCKFPGEGNILAVETTARGELLAILFKQSFAICKFDSTGLFKLRTKRFEQSIEWRKIKIGNHYLAVYGLLQGPSPDKVVKIFDLQRCLNVQPTSPRSPGDQEISELQQAANRQDTLIFDVLLSEKGLAAYCFERRILLRNLTTGDEQPLPLRSGLRLQRAAFGATGQWLCAWAIDVMNGYDEALFWDLWQPSTPCLHEVYEKMKIMSSADCSLWPFPGSPAFVLRDPYKGVGFLAHNVDGSKHAVQQRKDQKLAHILDAYVTDDNALLCLTKQHSLSRRRSMVQYRLQVQQNDGQSNRVIYSSTHQLQNVGNLGFCTKISPINLGNAGKGIVYYSWRGCKISAQVYRNQEFPDL